MPRRFLLLVLVMQVLSAEPSTADHGDNFRKGIEAWDKKRWQDVARHMADAVREQPREGETVRLYGQRYEDYLPHYYLGLALDRQGDCAGAMAALNESAHQGAVGGQNRRRLDEVRDACRQRLAAKPVPALPASRTAPETGDTTDGATDETAQADSATVAESTEQDLTVAVDSSSIESISAGDPPLTIRRAAASFLSGDYRQALETLEQFSSTEPKAAATAHLMQAAACYALYLEGGRRNEALRSRAVEGVHAWRSLDAGVTLPTSAFSPTLLSFLRDPD